MDKAAKDAPAEPVAVEQTLGRINRTMAKLERMVGEPAPQNESKSSARIEVNAGGLGLWIASTACLVMLIVTLGLLALFINHDRKIDDLNSYLNAIYMMAPHLKPEKESSN